MESDINELKSGLRIHSIIAGNKNNPSLVLLHGYPANNHLWHLCIPKLAEHFRVYAPDLPGHGRSDKPLDVDFDLDFLVQFLVDYYIAMGLETASLIGHDLGGTTALGFASRHPDRVNRFIVMNTAPYADWPIRLNILLSAIKIPLLARVMLMTPIFRMILKRFLYHRPERVSNRSIDQYRETWIESQTGQRAFSHVVRLPPERLTVRRNHLKKISMPTLVLWGANDPFFTVETARRLESDVAGSKLILIPGSGHFLQEEKPRQVVEHILSFLLPVEDDKACCDQQQLETVSA
jgi:pimeloyl-ACP methyl ester carboxylesterase